MTDERKPERYFVPPIKAWTYHPATLKLVAITIPLLVAGAVGMVFLGVTVMLLVWILVGLPVVIALAVGRS